MCAGRGAIEVDDLARAAALGDYWWAMAANIAQIEMSGETRRVERRIVSLLEANKDIWVRRRDFHQRLSGRVPANQFHQSIRALIRLVVLETSPSGEEERPKAVRYRRLE